MHKAETKLRAAARETVTSMTARFLSGADKKDKDPFAELKGDEDHP